MKRFIFRNTGEYDTGDLRGFSSLSEEQIEIIFDTVEEIILESIDFGQKQKDIKVEGKKIGEAISVILSPSEIAQGIAEKLNVELTPEIGFLIGLITATEINHPEKYAEKYARKKGGFLGGIEKL